MLDANNVIDIIGRTLDYVDPRLINHGLRVADTVLTVTKKQNRYTPAELRDIYVASLLHDIGAYKTAEISNIIKFESKSVWDHAIFGYLFLKHMTPIPHLAPAVLLHHTHYENLHDIEERHLELAQILHMADRMDILTMARIPMDEHSFARYFTANRGRQYFPDVIDMFHEAGFFTAGNTRKADANPLASFPDTILSEAEIASYLRLIVLSIDFRSHQTATHTNDVTCSATALAKLLGFDATEYKKIAFSAMLHDLGKQGIPLRILESPGKLYGEDMDIMRGHIILTENILQGKVSDEMFRIAVRHHEKLDGSGYPRGLAADELTLSERLMAVADIMSALFGVRSYKQALPRRRVMEILAGMANDERIDRRIVQAVDDNYDFILEKVGESSREALNRFDAMYNDYRLMRDPAIRFDDGDKTLLSLLPSQDISHRSPMALHA